ncbi:Nucleoporin NUP57 [Astathelohania contejeani]|uniref:Nucleoporin NUP57 n=1 Tax=Astathelohania contejeani TaxID=164912 RepID=A0ABQ7HYG8_9MICR|nr:Nucleoporin NUP57 [Thelohania contejeani]
MDKNTPQEVLAQLDRLEAAYDPQSPLYKFVYTFYNVAERRARPADFPPELWAVAIAQAPSPQHHPVLIRGTEELNRRIEMQRSVAGQLSEANEALAARVSALKQRSEVLYGRLQEQKILIRRVISRILLKYKIDTPITLDEIYRVRRTLNTIGLRSKFRMEEGKKEEVLDVLKVMKEICINMKENMTNKLSDRIIR